MGVPKLFSSCASEVVEGASECSGWICPSPSDVCTHTYIHIALNYFTLHMPSYFQYVLI